MLKRVLVKVPILFIGYGLGVLIPLRKDIKDYIHNHFKAFPCPLTSLCHYCGLFHCATCKMCNERTKCGLGKDSINLAPSQLFQTTPRLLQTTTDVPSDVLSDTKSLPNDIKMCSCASECEHCTCASECAYCKKVHCATCNRCHEYRAHKDHFATCRFCKDRKRIQHRKENKRYFF